MTIAKPTELPGRTSTACAQQAKRHFDAACYLNPIGTPSEWTEVGAWLANLILPRLIDHAAHIDHLEREPRRDELNALREWCDWFDQGKGHNLIVRSFPGDAQD